MLFFGFLLRIRIKPLVALYILPGIVEVPPSISDALIPASNSGASLGADLMPNVSIPVDVLDTSVTSAEVPSDSGVVLPEKREETITRKKGCKD